MKQGIGYRVKPHSGYKMDNGYNFNLNCFLSVIIFSSVFNLTLHNLLYKYLLCVCVDELSSTTDLYTNFQQLLQLLQKLKNTSKTNYTFISCNMKMQAFLHTYIQYTLILQSNIPTSKNKTMKNKLYTQHLIFFMYNDEYFKNHAW